MGSRQAAAAVPSIALRLPLPPPGRDDATVLVARPMPLSEVEALLQRGASAQERRARIKRWLLGGIAAATLLVIVSLAGYQVAMEMTGHNGFSSVDRSAVE